MSEPLFVGHLSPEVRPTSLVRRRIPMRWYPVLHLGSLVIWCLGTSVFFATQRKLQHTAWCMLGLFGGVVINALWAKFLFRVFNVDRSKIFKKVTDS